MGEEKLERRDGKPSRRRGDSIVDDVYRDVVAREDAHQQGQDKGRNITVRMPESGNEDIVAYGRSEMLDEFEKRMKKEGGPSYEGVEVGPLPLEDPERMEKIRDSFAREVREAESVRKELKERYGTKFLENGKESKIGGESSE